MLTLDKIYHAKFVLKKVARKTDLIALPRHRSLLEDRKPAGDRQLQGSRCLL